MTTSIRLPLALTLALPLAACDQPDNDHSAQFRSASSMSAPGTTVRFGPELDSVRVTSYSIGGALQQALVAEGFDALRSGAQGTDQDGQLVPHLDGVALPGAAASGEGFVELRRDDEVLEYPYKQFKFQVNTSGDGLPTTVLVLDSAADPDEGFALWHDPLGTAAPPPVQPVANIEYELISRDGTSTSCSADTLPVDQLSFGFTPIKFATGRFSFDIADTCADVLEAAADDSPPHAFFVRCDPTTTTASTGLHKLSNVTLKRGVFSGVADLEVEHLTQ